MLRTFLRESLRPLTRADGHAGRGVHVACPIVSKLKEVIGVGHRDMCDCSAERLAKQLDTRKVLSVVPSKLDGAGPLIGRRVTLPSRRLSFRGGHLRAAKPVSGSVSIGWLNSSRP
jgi:hypothetical protein